MTILRFIFVAVLAAVLPLSVLASTCKEYRMNYNGAPWASTPAAACQAGVDKIMADYGDVPDRPTYSLVSAVPGVCNLRIAFKDGRVTTAAPSLLERAGECQCAMPFVKNPSGQCVCPAGQKEKTDENGSKTCVPDSLCSELAGKPLGLPLNVDYGRKGPGSLARMIGQSTSTCFTGGCTVTGTVEGCWSANGSAGCSVTGASFTGEQCDDKAPVGGCPAGSSPSAYAAGVCVPDENKCPAGSSPSKYAAGVCIPDENKCPAGQSPSKYAAGVCVPNESGNADGRGESGDKSNCPPGRVASRYAAGVCIPADTTVGGGGGGGGTTTCKDGKCTTTDDDGNTEDETQDEFCKKNPDSAQCKKGNFGGSCGSWTCEGDAIQCAIAKEQHKTNCKVFDEKTSHPLTQAALDGKDEQSAAALKEKAVKEQMPENFSQTGFGWSHTCPPDPEIPLGFVSHSFKIPFSRICSPLNVLSIAGVGVTLLGCMVWVIGGKKA